MPVVSADTAGHYVWGDGCDGWHLVRSERLSVIQERIPPNAAEKRHYHESAEQFFYVLSGVATMELDGEIFAIHPQRDIHVIASAQNRTINRPRSDLVFTIIPIPPSQDDRVLV